MYTKSWAETVCNQTVIFPFINQAIADTGVDPSQVGFRAGFIESLFTFVQFLTILQWGRLSDRIGRRPVIVRLQLLFPDRC